uniref:Radical SAM core domain-containing protein n=1 Tax=Globodera pallida TaxID=36090 RepID=A0A183BI51_GLOPA
MLVLQRRFEECSHVLVECLVPDFAGVSKSVEAVVQSGLDVFAHNLETVRRLTPFVRDPRAKYDQSLHANPEILTKSSLMLGLGEADQEVEEAMRDLRLVGVEALTLGQYMQPTKRHLAVTEWVSPAKFDRWRELGEQLGFVYTASGPMSIEVKVSLSRKSAVFLTGENFTVQICLTNGDSEQERSLAWGCVQLHCEGNVSTAQKATDWRHNRSSSAAAASSTAVTRAKQAIFSSEPAILFCDIRLAPGAVQNFETQKEIPLDLPPSFKGHFAKYLWYVSVATQQVDAPIKMVQLPIKVLSVGIDVSAVKQSEPTGNPFLGNDFKSPSIVEIAVSRIEEVCSIRKQRFYEIKSGGRLIAAVVIFRNVFKLGDDVVGRFEFPQEEVQCLQALVRAEVVETNLMDDSSSREEASSSAQSVHVFGTEHMVTAFVRETHFKLQLPPPPHLQMTRSDEGKKRKSKERSRKKHAHRQTGDPTAARLGDPMAVRPGDPMAVRPGDPMAVRPGDPTAAHRVEPADPTAAKREAAKTSGQAGVTTTPDVM